MEVATTNNQNHHHHLYSHSTHPTQRSSSNAISTSSGGAATAGGGSHSPFQREVREWQRIDPDTGALLTGRLEADRWHNGPLHSYGKKSSSSISSNNSSSNNSIIGTTTPSATTTTINTHKNASKISLHAIVSNNSNNNDDTKSSSSSVQPAATVTSAKTSWQQQQQRSSRHFEQPTLYGNINSSLTKSRVGGDGSMVGDAADDHRHQHHNHPQQSDELTPTQLNRQQQQQQSPPRRDSESFRHYNNHDHGLFAASSAKNRIDHLHHDDDNDGDDDVAADDDDMRLTPHHQRRQQRPFTATTNSTSLQLSRSISNDDLSTEWDAHSGAAGEEEPGEWRRVSKLRRSFQSTTTSSTANEAHNGSPRSTRRPLDLPTNSVSVSKIRAELENGRRLNTAMRNNHVDLAALDTILNGPTTAAETKQSATAKQTSFLTAESLKEIRGRLKKLSDESLYKEDFLTYQQLPANEQIVEVQHVKSVQPQTTDRRLRQLTPEQSPEISSIPKSAFHAVAKQQHTAVTPHSSNFQSQRSLPTGGAAREKQHTTNSLESRQKLRDTTSAEWHLRRKSYGFEKMASPDDKTMFGMDASTDSGLGRSGELGNWSPTESTPAVRSTVIHFGEPARTASNANILAQKRYRELKSPEDMPEGDEEVRKRHSIAVDESQYVRDNLRKTSQVHLNGFYDTETSKSLQTETTTSSTAAALFQRTQQKRVEFCKTEVHFAAESGRVNIVETDGKPPPTNNFRRRRRTSSGPLQSLVKSASTVSTNSSSSSGSAVALPITHFGDDHHRRKTIATTMVAYKASLVDAPPETSISNALEPSPSTNVTVSVVPKLTETYTLTQESSRNSYASTSGIDSTTDGENDEISAIRGILKNKPIKPKPYHLGENIDSADALWGVQLKPIGGGSSGPGTALISRRDIAPSKSDSPISAATLNKSVAERVRIVEKGQDLTTANGYSTKINLSLNDSLQKDWTESELPKSNVMSIELHSPQQSTLDKQQNAAANARGQLHRTHIPPVAKPRTIANAKQTDNPLIHTATTVKQMTNNHQLQHSQHLTIEPKNSLKIIKEARGARKLREHELSYFGVPVSKNDITNTAAANNEVKTTTKIQSTKTPKRSLPQRKYIEEQTINDLNREKQATKWQLVNDKPDLLRHSPIAVEPQVIPRIADIKPLAHKHTQQHQQQQQQIRKVPRSPIKAFESEDEEMEEDDDDSENIDDHFYENIANEITPAFKVKSPTSYDRKMDLKRDALILSEMTKNADQTMKALSDEAAIKDQRRRSLQRRNSKPLETIEEKGIAEKINGTCIAVKVSRSTLATEAKRTARRSNTPSPTTVGGGNSRVRTSSQSSTESCPRARSRSLSSEREYENVKVVRPAAQRSSSASTKPAPATKVTKKLSNRSSSLESRHATHVAQYSSGDETCKRNEERLRAKPKRVSYSSGSRETRVDNRSSKEESANVRKVKRHHQSLKDGEGHGSEKQQQLLHRGSTTHSSQRERIECSKPQHHHHHHHRSSSGGSSSRRRKDEHEALHKSVGRSSVTVAVATGSLDEKRAGHTSRLVRSAHVLGHERDATHRSSQRSERAGKAQENKKENESLSRSKGHPSRPTTAQNNDRQHHSSSPHGATDTKKLLREHKSNSATTMKTISSSDNITHSKNGQIINGHHDGHQREHRSHSHHRHHQQQHQADHQQHHHSHPTATTTIAAKHRSERHGKDRK